MHASHSDKGVRAPNPQNRVSYIEHKMAKHSRHIPKTVKQHLIEESQGKCANPGCCNIRLEIHHIKEWAVYKSHDSENMIAVCPACHDACHHGELIISDETLYEWKKITRPSDKIHSQIYVEQSSISKLLIGTIALQQAKKRKVTVIKFSAQNKLEFYLDNDWININTTITNNRGKKALEVINNRLTLNKDEDFTLTQRPGKLTITVPANKFYLPAYALLCMRRQEPSFADDDRVIALDLEVIKPGHVRVQGFWTHDNQAVVITNKTITFCKLHTQEPQFIYGEGEDSVIVYDGPVTTSVFELAYS